MILVGQTYFRILTFEYYTGCLIEGVGGCSGLLEDLTTFEGGSWLCSLYNDSTLIYPASPCNLSPTDTCLTVNIKNFDLIENNLVVYPNPTKANTHIELYIHNNALYELAICYIFGKVIRKVFRQHLTSGSHSFNIDVSNLSGGIYICILKSDHLILTNSCLTINQFLR